MSKTYIPYQRLLNALTTGFLVAGIAMVTVSTVDLVQANIIGPGTIVTLQSSSSMYAPRLGVDAEAAAQNATEMRLIMGMLLVLAGFGFHALTVVRGKTAKRRHSHRSKLAQRVHTLFYRRLV